MLDYYRNKLTPKAFTAAVPVKISVDTVYPESILPRKNAPTYTLPTQNEYLDLISALHDCPTENRLLWYRELPYCKEFEYLIEVIKSKCRDLLPDQTIDTKFDGFLARIQSKILDGRSQPPQYYANTKHYLESIVSALKNAAIPDDVKKEALTSMSLNIEECVGGVIGVIATASYMLTSEEALAHWLQRIRDEIAEYVCAYYVSSTAVAFDKEAHVKTIFAMRANRTNGWNIFINLDPSLDTHVQPGSLEHISSPQLDKLSELFLEGYNRQHIAHWITMQVHILIDTLKRDLIFTDDSNRTVSFKEGEPRKKYRSFINRATHILAQLGLRVGILFEEDTGTFKADFLPQSLVLECLEKQGVLVPVHYATICDVNGGYPQFVIDSDQHLLVLLEDAELPFDRWLCDPDDLQLLPVETRGFLLSYLLENHHSLFFASEFTDEQQLFLIQLEKDLEPKRFNLTLSRDLIERLAARKHKNFTNLNLHEIDLRGLNLRGVNLRGADLSSLDLTDVNLSGACLIGANLSGSNLSYADLSNTELYGVDFSGVCFSESPPSLMLYNTHLSAIQIQQLYASNFKNFAHIDSYKTDLSGNDLSEAYFADAKFIGANFSRAILVRTNFSVAKLSHANLRDTDFTCADLTLADLSGADLSRTNFNTANLFRANLSGANLLETIFSNADLSFVNFSSSDLRGANFSNSYFSGRQYPILRGARLTGKQISLFRNAGVTDFTKVDLSGEDLSDLDLSGIDLSGADLSGTNLSGTNLSNVTLPNINFADISFSAERQPILTGTHLIRDQVTLFRAHGFTNFSGVDLSNVSFYQFDLSNADLSDANFTGANLFGATLTGIHFTSGHQPILRGVRLTNYQLELFHGLGVTLFPGVDLSATSLRNLVSSGLDFSGATFSFANLSDADLSDATLTGANFTDAILNHTLFARSNS